MTHDELVALIRKGIGTTGGIWADFGAGAGNFTRALRELLGDDATIYAVDRDVGALNRQKDDITTITADFTQLIQNLPQLDGLLIANALHFNRNQQTAMTHLANYLRSGGTFIIVEYELSIPRGYVPFPLPFARFKSLAESSSLLDVQQIGNRTSPRSGTTMYAACATTP